MKETIKPDWERVNKIMYRAAYKLDERDTVPYMDEFDFCNLIHSLFISKYGYVIDTGTWENVNYVCAYELIRAIKKHPIIWKLFFMVRSKLGITEPNWERANEIMSRSEDKSNKRNLIPYMDGYDFCLFMQRLLVSKHGLGVEAGDWENTNYVCAYKLIKAIKKHSILWNLFFMIA